MITSPEDNTLKYLAHHCHPDMIQADEFFTVAGTTAHVLGIKRLSNLPPFLVLGGKPFTPQAEKIQPGIYALVRLCTASSEELRRWNARGGARREKPEELFCLEVLTRQWPGKNLWITGECEFFVSLY